MINRALYPIAFAEQWGRQMRFITGPRQSGKTTLARQILDAEGSGRLYYLWDLRSVRQRYKAHELFFTADAYPAKKPLWVCFDEIHKMPNGKIFLRQFLMRHLKNIILLLPARPSWMLPNGPEIAWLDVTLPFI